MLTAMRQADGAKHQGGAAAGVVPRTAGDSQRQGNVLFRRQRVQKLKRLKHQSDLPPPQESALVFT
jgi:hypothetical protein